MNPVLHNEWVSLWYHPEERIVHHKIHKFPSSEAFRQLLDTGAEYIEKHRATKWLSDDRDSYVLREDDLLWGDTVWGPRVIRAGFKHWAIVVPASAIGQLNMRRLADEYRQRGVSARSFEEVDLAFQWLIEQK